MGRRRATARGAGEVRRWPGDPVRHPRAGRAGPRAGGGGPGRTRVATAPGEDPDRAPRERRRGFTFLGFEHRMRESWKQPGRWYLQKWPSRRAMASIRGKIRDRTDRRYARLPLEYAVENVNRAVRGWGNYFRYGNSGRKFSQIDAYVNERLAILASAKHGLQGRNWVDRFNYEWSTQLGVYRLTGTVKPTLAYASR